MVNNASKEQSLMFEYKLNQETNLLKEWFEQRRFSEDEFKIGAEIEFFLLDKQLEPVPKNLEFIKLVDEKFLIPEVGAAHLEINSNHYRLSGDCFSSLHQNILESWRKCSDIAKQNNYDVALIGSLPTASQRCHKIDYITKKKRYSQINDYIKEINNGHPIDINLEGSETLTIQAESLAMNGLISAFQLHLQVPQTHSVNFYNSAQIISGPLLALSCNSPFMFGINSWSDSRIFIFDQMMTLFNYNNKSKFKCCFFGTKYLQTTFYDLFEENSTFFPRLIPGVSEHSSLNEMFHVRKQNGVVYRWNRPVIDFNKEGTPHLRIEHRGPSSGPTIVDMVANAVFYYGLIYYFSLVKPYDENKLPFNLVKRNFFNAAKYGLKATFSWMEGTKLPALVLIDYLLPKAYEGLSQLGVNKQDAIFYLNIIKRRIDAAQNGSSWQIKFVEKYGKDFKSLMSSYLYNQYSEKPVSDWKL